MRVLVTGAFGNLGLRTVEELLSQGHAVRAFDLPTKANRRAAKKLGGRVEAVFGDICDEATVRAAVDGVDAVIHDAAIIPPMSEKLAEKSREVNVGGTRNLLRALEEGGAHRPFVFASSFSIFGPGASNRTGAPVTAESPVEATDQYTSHKIECEAMLRASTVPWCILRIGVALDEASSNTDPLVFRMMFEVDPANHLHFVHTTDVARAQANAVSRPEAWRKVLLIGGGEGSRITQRDLHAQMLELLQIRDFPESAFGSLPYYTCWMDTTEAQALLDFQRISFPQMRQALRARYRPYAPLLWLLRPVTKRVLLHLSGPYRGASPRAGWKDFAEYW